LLYLSSCLLDLLAFKSLGGRFWALVPSSLVHWVIHTMVYFFSENYTNASQRTLIERMGRKWDCLTCGSRMFFKSSKFPTANKVFRFVGDHMPPKSVAKHIKSGYEEGLLPKIKFRFYQQCVSCSTFNDLSCQ